jgi:hypothetical protein
MKDDNNKENKISQNNSNVNNSANSNMNSIKEKEQHNDSTKDLSSSNVNNNTSAYFNNNTNFSHIAKTVKQMGNKSVLIVKPNQYNQENKMSLKKMNTHTNPQTNSYNEVKVS